MLKLVAPFAALCLILCACGSKPTEQKTTATPKQAVSIDTPENNAAPTPPPPPAPPAPTGTSPDSAPAPESPAGPEASDDAISQYNRALAKWIYSRDDVPSDLADLKRKQGLPPLPAPPPGKQIIYTPNFNSPTASKISVQ